MKITFLGTGTSCGVPFIGCRCPVCTSQDPRDKRWRSSILVEAEGEKIVVDTGYEFRLQCLRAGIDQISAILYTHTHPDHLVGLDDLRAFSKKGDIPVYATKENLDSIQNAFSYAFRPFQREDGVPHLKGREIRDGEEFMVGKVKILPFLGKHGCRNVTGYRFGKVAYFTDVSDTMEEKNMKYLQNLDVLIIDGLMDGPHPTHLSFTEASEFGLRTGAKKVYFTHIGHSMKHQDILEKFRGIAEPAYDTLILEVDDE